MSFYWIRKKIFNILKPAASVASSISLHAEWKVKLFNFKMFQISINKIHRRRTRCPYYDFLPIVRADKCTISRWYSFKCIHHRKKVPQCQYKCLLSKVTLDKLARADIQSNVSSDCLANPMKIYLETRYLRTRVTS